ncbi:MAG TPA: hypothetical protein PK079_17385 [Leptospiraceae bacterium]|nr:hypothetical protein [Leptospiraceae bacterium]HMW06478.1 hypothetical protein [Leptospiraceae bacterium]HMX32420.1 hypothetical protein [Leptospiraceae bacterium]HMY33663.1 hypothetical protein [Leptospiraceae bacterium]HMZ65214.1 hypothetical protein [Leptospiraceae bacterium]
MQTILIQVTNEKAYKILADLEDLNLLKILKQMDTIPKKLSQKYAGKLDSTIIDEFQKFVQNGRNEWNNASI